MFEHFKMTATIRLGPSLTVPARALVSGARLSSPTKGGGLTAPRTGAPAPRRTGSTASRGRSARLTVAAGPRANNGSSVVMALSALLTALGIPNKPSSLRRFLGGGDGTGDGGRGNAGIAKRLIEYYFWGMFQPPMLPCVSCTDTCSRRVTVKIDIARVVAATERLVRAMDAALRAYTKLSLMEHVYRYLTDLIDHKLVSRRVPVLRHTGIRPIFRLGSMLQYNVTRGIRMKVLEWVFENYVDYYLPSGIKYNLSQLNAKFFSDFRPQVLAFLKGTDADLAPVVGFLVFHLVKVNQVKLNLNAPNLGCVLCENLPFSCNYKLTTLATRAILARTAFLSRFR
jgi:hypothetical protein